MKRWIMHVDMDAFFASVEQRDNPELRGKPVIVGGDSRRGVVATASYEARKYGVHSAMPSLKAHELCPEGIFVRPRFDAYKKASDEIHQIMLHYADAYEPISLDEAFLDISGMGEKYKTLGAIGRAIKKEIYDKVHLVASVGIAPNKFLAKMASDMDKPDGLFIIPYGKEKEILAPLPVRRLCGGELRARAFGKDDRPIETERQIKAIGDEETYEHDLTDPEEIDRQIAIHSDIVAQRLRKHDLTARTISLKIRFGSFETVMRSMSREDGTNLQEEIYAMCQELLQRIPIREGIRLIGVTGSNLSSGPRMTSLFSHDWEKREKAARAMDEIQKKFGRQALRKGFWLEEEAKKDSGKEKNKDE